MKFYDISLKRKLTLKKSVLIVILFMVLGYGSALIDESLKLTFIIDTLMIVYIIKKYFITTNWEVKDKLSMIRYVTLFPTISVLIYGALFFYKVDHPSELGKYISIVYLINILLTGPIFEEILFRGILLETQLNWQTEKKAFWINLLVFFFLHLPSFSGLVSIYIMTRAYVKFRSVGFNILLHISINLTQTILAYSDYFKLIYVVTFIWILSFSVIFVIQFTKKKKPR